MQIRKLNDAADKEASAAALIAFKRDAEDFEKSWSRKRKVQQAALTRAAVGDNRYLVFIGWQPALVKSVLSTVPPVHDTTLQEEDELMAEAMAYATEFDGPGAPIDELTGEPIDGPGEPIYQHDDSEFTFFDEMDLDDHQHCDH